MSATAMCYCLLPIILIGVLHVRFASGRLGPCKSFSPMSQADFDIEVRGLRDGVVKDFRFETTRPSLCGSGSNTMRGSCQLLTEGCWFTSGTLCCPPYALYGLLRLRNGVKHKFTSLHHQ